MLLSPGLTDISFAVELPAFALKGWLPPLFFSFSHMILYTDIALGDKSARPTYDGTTNMVTLH
jgi:hypothetical protein